MGQHNIENDFKQKLNEREIMPSAAAWDRLDAMLTVAEGKKKKRGFGWLYMAASILGFILVTTVYFSQTQEMIDVGHDNVVLENQPKVEKQIEAPAEAVATYEEPTAVATVSVKKAAARKIKSSIAPVVRPGNQQIAQQTIINQKNEQEIKTKTTYVDADELLAAVEKEGQTRLTFPGKEKVKVNPGTLLSQVDGELDLTFREKALRTISRQYQKVNVALSNRNNE